MEEEKKEKREEAKAQEKNGVGFGFWTTTIIIYCLFFAVEYFYFSRQKTMIINEEWNWGWVIFFTQTLYTIFSFKIVGPTELAAILFFGRPIKSVSSGLIFVPLGICQLAKETRLTIQDEIPADPEHIFRGDGATPPNMFPPIRIPFNDRPEGDDPLSRRITAEIVPVIRWRIKDYICFLTTIGSRQEAKRQMEDATVGLCMRELPHKTVAEALIGLKDFNIELQKTIEEMVEKWGIHTETAQIKQINFHHALNDSISSVPEAEFKAKATVKTAEAEKKKRSLEGAGSGAAEKAILDGRTEGIENMAKKLSIASSIILNAETARAITNNPGQKTVITGVKGFSDLIGIATGIEKTLKDEEGGKK